MADRRKGQVRPEGRGRKGESVVWGGRHNTSPEAPQRTPAKATTNTTRCEKNSKQNLKGTILTVEKGGE